MPLLLPMPGRAAAKRRGGVLTNRLRAGRRILPGASWSGLLIAALLLGTGCSVLDRAAAERAPSGGPPAGATAKPPRPGGTTAPPPSTEVAKPEPSETAAPAPPRPDRSLKGNSLYAVDLDRRSVSCRLSVRSPKPPLPDSDLAPYLRRVVRCLVKAYEKPLAAQGFVLTTPKIKTYSKSVRTPCGRFDQDEAPAYYCSSTRTIYWPASGDDDSEAYTFARLGYVGLLAHEFGHHLQATTGMLVEYGSRYYAAKKTKRYALSRRLELQAQCFEGVFLAAAGRTLRLTDDDLYQLHQWHGFTGDEDPPAERPPDHGSSAAQNRWLDRGLEEADFGRCNTWTASAKSVR